MHLQTPSVLSEKFDSSFEENILHLLYRDTTFATKYYQVLKQNYFGSMQHRALFEAFVEYYSLYKRLPNFMEAQIQVVKEFGEEAEVLTSLKTILERIYTKDIPNADFLDTLIMEFVKKAELSKTIWEAVNNFDALDLDDFKTKINDIANLKNKTSNMGISSDDFIQRILLKEDEYGDGIHSSFRHFDNIVRGGLRKGELVVLLAPTNRGKTAALVNFGRSYLTMGASVLHYSLEMPEDDIMERYVASMTRVRINDLSSPSLYRGIASILQNYDIFTDKKLFIKFFPAKTASVLDIEAHYSILRERGIKPDIILLDYADLLKPPRDRKDKRFELGELYEQIRAFAMTAGIPVITASQTNRQGELNDYDYKNRENLKIPTALNIAHISEDWSKAATADYIFGIRRPYKHATVCKTSSELLLVMDTLKSRHSARDQTLGFIMDFTKCYMEDISLTGIDLKNAVQIEDS